ncbi:hypothetical protein IMSAGC003_01207 [Lachnospiraceae bacterium]|jgi:hypothetical protein|nr:hypothetical protein [Lachnospiraceae bacterium]MCX4270897.1 hypothetical protein [Acetatifactor sp.]GFH94675.1 hypothetical protein IMSAGC003_01207 [Lachnospiraceae bacterium]
MKKKDRLNENRNLNNCEKRGETGTTGPSRQGRLWLALAGKSSGIDGLLVTVGLCIIALLLCVVMKDKLEVFLNTIVDALTAKATGILG